MNLNLNNKKVVITGSSSGIGKEIAQFFASEGCKVVINGRDENKLLKASSEIDGSFAVSGDVSSNIGATNLIQRSIELMDGIDILICNAGSGDSCAPGLENFEEWQKVFNTNFFSATNTIEAAKKYLIESKGVIVCISSICGLETVKSAPVTYSVAKAALNKYIKCISKVLGKDGVRINGIAPGNIIFPGSTWAKKLTEDKKSTQEMLLNSVPLNKFGKPEDIASLTLYLSSDESNFVTGSIWTIDGGQVNS